MDFPISIQVSPSGCSYPYPTIVDLAHTLDPLHSGECEMNVLRSPVNRSAMTRTMAGRVKSVVEYYVDVDDRRLTFLIFTPDIATLEEYRLVTDKYVDADVVRITDLLDPPDQATYDQTKRNALPRKLLEFMLYDACAQFVRHMSEGVTPSDFIKAYNSAQASAYSNHVHGYDVTRRGYAEQSSSHDVRTAAAKAKAKS